MICGKIFLARGIASFEQRLFTVAGLEFSDAGKIAVEGPPWQERKTHVADEKTK